MAVVFYIWLIPLLLIVFCGLGGLYLCIQRDWPNESEKVKRSDLEIALEMEAREAKAVAHTHPPVPLSTASGANPS